MNKLTLCRLALGVFTVSGICFGQDVQTARIDGPFWPKISKETKILVEESMLQLGKVDPSQRMSGKMRLLNADQDVVPELIKGLYNENPLIRTSCAAVLGERHAQNSVKYLIEAFYAAMPDSGQAATYQRTFVRALRVALTAITGQVFSGVEARSPLIQKDLLTIIAWYIENLDQLPPQVGEPPIDPTDRNYMKKLALARGLNLEKRYWSVPPLSVEMALGERPGDEPEYVRPEDIEFLNLFRVVDRKTGNGFFREEDRLWAEDLLRQSGRNAR